MSEQRFTKECGNNGLTCRIWDNGLPMTTDEVVDTLNEQQAILIKQEQKIKHLREVLTEIYVMSVQESIISEERSENDG